MTEAEVRSLITDTLRYVSNRPDLVARLTEEVPGPALTSLGLDSLDALEWCMEIETRCGVELDPAEIALHDSLDRLTSFLAGRLPDGPKEKDIPVAPRDRPIPLSFAQETTWLRAKNGVRDYVLAMLDRISGPLDAETLRACLDAIVLRHEILRTSYAEHDGRPVQVVHAHEPVSLPVVDVPQGADIGTVVRQTMAAEMDAVTDLTKAPLVRFLLLRQGPNEHWLLRATHHIAWDAESTRLLIAEIATLYPVLLAGKTPPAPPRGALNYADYAAWQRSTFAEDGDNFAKEITWWKDHLKSAPPMPPLPFARAQRVSGVPVAEGSQTNPVGADLTNSIARFGRAEGATTHTIWVAAFAAVLAAEMRMPGVTIGSYVTGRRRPQLKSMIGFFSSQTLFGIRCDASLSFASLVAHAKAVVLGAETHCDLSYTQARDALVKRGFQVPGFDIIFQAPLASLNVSAEFAGISLTRPELGWVSPVMPWGVTVRLHEKNGRQSCDVTFDAGRYDPEKIRAFILRLQRFLTAALSEPSRPLAEIAALSVEPAI